MTMKCLKEEPRVRGSKAAGGGWGSLEEGKTEPGSFKHVQFSWDRLGGQIVELTTFYILTVCCGSSYIPLVSQHREDLDLQNIWKTTVIVHAS